MCGAAVHAYACLLGTQWGLYPQDDVELANDLELRHSSQGVTYVQMFSAH